MLFNSGDVRVDADTLAFFARQLEYQKSQTYDVKYPANSAMSLFPVSTEAGPGAESITYTQFDTVGAAKFIGNDADDAPLSDIKGQQFTIPVRSIGDGYKYSGQEIRAAMMAGRPLSTMKAMAARRSIDQKLNQIGWFADGTETYAGLTGILYNANITKAAATTGTWASATPDQIIADVNTALNQIKVLTKGVEMANTVAMAIASFTIISTTPRSATSDTTILQFLQANHPEVTFVGVPELDNVTPNPRTGSGSANLLLAYNRNPTNLQFEIPMMFNQLAPQPRNYYVVVPVEARVSSVNVYYPLSVYLMDGI